MDKGLMELDEVRRTWDILAAVDPLWAICAEPDKKGNGWDLDEFMATGVTEVDQLMRQIEDFGLTPERRHALDFGCGVGRLTQPLGKHFDRVTGVDISRVMIDIARGRNRRGARCRYVVSDGDDLSAFRDGQFDLVYSNVTLQHMPPRFAFGYIREFLRLLSPSGVVVFQLPSHGSGWRGGLRTVVPGALRQLHRRLWRGSEPQMQMRAIRRERVVTFIEEAGGRLLAIEPDGSVDRSWVSYRYFASR